MTAHRLARATLRLDAAFCVSLGTATILLAPRFAPSLAVSSSTLRAAGGGTIAWGAAVRLLSSRSRWRRGLSTVGAANSAAAVALLVGSLAHPSRDSRVALALTGLLVGTVAASQQVARRLSG